MQHIQTGDPAVLSHHFSRPLGRLVSRATARYLKNKQLSRGIHECDLKATPSATFGAQGCPHSHAIGSEMDTKSDAGIDAFQTLPMQTVFEDHPGAK
jgi:hypothetical protein